MLAKKALAAALSTPAAEPVYVEDVFSTYLYTGNGSSQTITNGILLGDGPENGTVLQLSGDSIADSSPLTKTLTNTNSVTVNTSIKKYGTGSLEFNGTSNYLSTAASSAWDFGTGDFTIEFWVRFKGTSGYQTLLDINYNSAPNIVIQPGFSVMYVYVNGASVGLSSTSISGNTWYHFAVVRKSGTLTLYQDGVSVSTATYAGNVGNSSATAYIGGSPGGGGYYLNGYLDDLRITKGTARYTANFTPPAAALPLDTLVEGQGGLVWIKDRSSGTYWHCLYDTERGATKELYSNRTDAQATSSTSLTAFNSNGFSLGSFVAVNANGDNNVSWTFRKAKKFFDVVTYTGNGTAGRTISHNLGSTPGCVIIKRTSDDSGWAVYHRSLNVANNESFQLNSSIASFTTEQYWNYTAPTSTEITLGNNATVNGNGSSYVAYIFAHDAGGFGDDGDQSVIKCDSVTATGGNVEVNLGWEPQWVLVKNASANENWRLLDNMRGITNASTKWLFPNTSGAETDNSGWNELTSTGFKLLGWGSNGNKYVYIAIRRGPMKTPEAGTEVFSPVVGTGNDPSFTSSWPVDASILLYPTGGNANYQEFNARLIGENRLVTSSTAAESSNSSLTWDYSNGICDTAFTSSFVANLFRRAPGFFDVVCYTGTGSVRTVSHNLGVAPEMMIVRARTGTGRWATYVAPVGATKRMLLELTNSATIDSSYWNDTAPTASVFTVATSVYTNNSTTPYVAYLFGSCPGVSKVGSVTVTGAAINVDCGFTSGARFVLMKRYSDTGPWLVWDSARGIVAGNDPYLKLNSTQAENGDGAADFIDPLSSGFTIAAGGIDGYFGSGDYIYLAIA